MDKVQSHLRARSEGRAFLLLRIAVPLIPVMLTLAAWASWRIAEPRTPADIIPARTNAQIEKVRTAHEHEEKTLPPLPGIFDIQEVEIENPTPVGKTSLKQNAVAPSSAVGYAEYEQEAGKTEDPKNKTEHLKKLPQIVDFPPHVPFVLPALKQDPKLPSAPNGPEPSIAGPMGDPARAALSKLPAPIAADRTVNVRYVQDVTDPTNTFDVIHGRTRLLILKTAPKRIHITADGIITSTISGNNDLIIVGHQVGETVLNLWFAAVEDKTKEDVVRYVVRVTPDSEARFRQERILKVLENEINQVMPGSRIQLKLIGNVIVISGQAQDAHHAEQVVRLVAANAPSDAARHTVADQRHPKIVNLIRVSSAQLHAIEQKAVDQRRAGCSEQIILKVVVAELNRTAAVKLGTKVNLPGKTPCVDRGQYLQAMHTLGRANCAKFLAEPSVMALDGQTVKCESGAASGIPNRMKVELTPVVVDRERIRLFVAAHVFARDGTAAQPTSDVPNAPGISSVVELNVGETLAMGGLNSTHSSANRLHFPFLRMGADERELLLFVTPELVRPDQARPMPVGSQHVLRGL